MKDFNIDEEFEFNEKKRQVYELIDKNIALEERIVLYKTKAEMAETEALAWKKAYEALLIDNHQITGAKDINEEPILIDDIVRRYDGDGNILMEGTVDFGYFEYERNGNTALLWGYFIDPEPQIRKVHQKGIPLFCFGFFGEDKERNEIIGSGGETFEEEERRKHKR